MTPDYEQGYTDGESSGYADWLMALDEEFDLDQVEIDGPQDFIKWLRANDSFKRGRQAGQEDVCREILKFDPSFAHQIAREFLAQYGQSSS